MIFFITAQYATTPTKVFSSACQYVPLFTVTAKGSFIKLYNTIIDSDMKKMILSLATMFAVVTIAIGQNVGIGTNTPVALLHVNNGNVLFSGPNLLGNTLL